MSHSSNIVNGKSNIVNGKSNIVDYSAYASEFSLARPIKKWNYVEKFLTTVNVVSMLDVGCGNGRNMHNYETKSLGIELCPKLYEIAKESNYNVLNMNILDYESTQDFNCVLCISIIQHILNKEDRIRALTIMLRALSKNGKMLINEWLPKSKITAENYSSIVNIPFKTNEKIANDRYYYIYSPGEFLSEIKTASSNLSNGNFTITNEVEFDNSFYTIERIL